MESVSWSGCCGGRGLLQSGGQSITSWDAETLVPEVHGGGDEAVMGRCVGDTVELAVVITSEDLPLCAPFLDRKPEVIKLNIKRIITS